MVKGKVRKCNQGYNDASIYLSWLRFKVCPLLARWLCWSGWDWGWLPTECQVLAPVGGLRTGVWRIRGCWRLRILCTGLHWTHLVTGHAHRPGQEYLDREGFWFQQQTTQPCPCERRTTINNNNILFCWPTALQCLAQSSYSISILYIIIMGIFFFISII